MTSQNEGSYLPPVFSHVVIESNFQRWFLRMTNGTSISNKLKFGYALALSRGIFRTTIGLILGNYE
ncbi:MULTISPECIES: hypothetical protein [unclassified Nostoc]|uniref:hypothetical protein n=1 Tax=unclassified Nostoc TaxID=2593658 RepID=UPI00117F435F|nr:hypothetical protein [Nostoc sp. 'Peltigera membranacea cyanobiont' 232]